MNLLNFDPASVGFWWVIGFIIGLWGVFNIAQSRATPLSKAIWCAIVLLGNWLGLALWFFLGPRSGRR